MDVCSGVFWPYQRFLQDPTRTCSLQKVVLTLFKEASVTLKLKKCAFFTNHIAYFGQAIKRSRLKAVIHTADAIGK